MTDRHAGVRQESIPGAVGLLVVFFICFVNVSGTQINNMNIALLQMAFVMASFYFLRSALHYLGVFGAAIILISISLVFSNLFAINDGVGLADWNRAFQFVMHLVFGAALFCLFLRVKNAQENVAYTVMLAVLIYACVLIFVWNYLESPDQWDWIVDIPLFRHIRHFACFLCAGMVISAWSVFFNKGYRRTVSLFVFLMAVTMILWSGGRGAFLAGCVGLAMLSFQYPVRQYSRIWRHLFIAGLGAFTLSALFPVADPFMGWLPALYRTELADSLDEVSSGRIYIWKVLSIYIAERPWFGWGGEAVIALRGNFEIVQAHNAVVQLLVEWGGVGTMLVLGAIGSLLLCGTRILFSDQRSKERTYLVLGISLTTAMLLLSLVDGVFYHGTPMTFLMIGLALVGAEVVRRRVAGDGSSHG